jgi:hypothetical protein
MLPTTLTIINFSFYFLGCGASEILATVASNWPIIAAPDDRRLCSMMTDDRAGFSLSIVVPWPLIGLLNQPLMTDDYAA